MISYAHHHEDVVLNRVFQGRSDGFFVDVGASHPRVGSVTHHFVLQGWCGINVEPNPNMFRELCKARTGDININAAISEERGCMTYFDVIDSSAESTLSATQAERLREQGRSILERTVEVLTLADVLACHAPDREIDFLSIDVEGHERAVLAGCDFRRWRPRVLLIEAVEPNTNIPCHERWEDLVLAAGYLFAQFDGINRFYVRREDNGWLQALSTPANPLDEAISAREVELEKQLERYQSYGRAARTAARFVQVLVNALRKVNG